MKGDNVPVLHHPGFISKYGVLKHKKKRILNVFSYYKNIMRIESAGEW